MSITQKQYEDSIVELGIYKETVKLPFNVKWMKDELGRNLEPLQRVEIVKFDSCEEMIFKIEAGKTTHGWDHKGQDKDSFIPGTRSDSWTFGALKNYDATLEALKTGIVLDAVLKDANEISQKLMESPTVENLFLRAETMKRKRVFSEEGSELDIDRVLCGDPQHWSRMTKGKRNTLVRLGVNLAGNCGEDEKLFNRLAAITGVATDILTRAGYAVELVSCSSSYGTAKDNNTLGFDIVSVVLKKAEEALDLQRIYSIGASGFFRCWVFQVYCNVLTGQPQSGLGRTCPISPSVQEHLGLDYVIDSSFVNGISQEIAIENLFNSVISSK